jgi:hypothetical protein
MIDVTGTFARPDILERNGTEMKTRTMTYYERDGRKLREITRVLIDTSPGVNEDASLEPVFWQHPLIIAPVLWGCDGQPRNSTEMECLVRYTWVRNAYFCIVQEAGMEKEKAFLQDDCACWLEGLGGQIALWLQELYGGMVERPLPPLDAGTPPPPDEIPLDESAETVYLIDGYGASLPNLKQANEVKND